MKDIKSILLTIVLIFIIFLIITPMASAELINTPEGAIITHYPDKFDGVGFLDSIEERGIVIDDMFVPFASSVRYMTPYSAYSSLSAFKQGKKVGYLLNDDWKNY